MEKQGWVKAHKSREDNPRYTHDGWAHLRMWMDLQATHTERNMIFNGERVTLSPGQFITSRRTASARTGLNESKIERLWKHMAKDLEIEQATSSTNRLITLLNWSNEQSVEPPVNRDRTTDEPRADHDRTSGEQRPNTNKNVKKVENGENGKKPASAPPDQSMPSEQFETLWTLWPRKVNKKRAIDAFKAAMNRADFDTIRIGVEQASTFYAEKGTEQRLIPHFTTWLRGDRWTDDIQSERRKNLPQAQERERLLEP